MITLIYSYATTCAGKEIIYGYDKFNNEIYAQFGHEIKKMKFIIDYENNPSYSFDFFSGAPAIVSDGRSLHDFTAYATLEYKDNQFHIDCLYYNVKSKKNGILIKEGMCGLNTPVPQNYAEYIEGKITDIENNIDSYDTSLILNGKVKHISIIIYRDVDNVFYQVYDSKQSFLNDKYTILHMNNSRGCEVYVGNPWWVTDATIPLQFNIMTEDSKNGKITITNSSPKYSDRDMCSLYPAISVKLSKAFLYDSSLKMKKAYLIKNYKVNLISISDDGKWCRIEYINQKNKSVYGNMQCTNLNL